VSSVDLILLYKTQSSAKSLTVDPVEMSSSKRKSKAQCYQTLVRPLMEYACTIWDPHTKENINKLEAVQRRSARFEYMSMDVVIILEWISLV
jgi:hypothetical protein